MTPKIMIRPSSDLRNKYTEISEYCKKNNTPVFLTENGIDNLVVMSLATYERMVSIADLHAELSKGMQDIVGGHTKPMEDVFIFF